MRSTASLLVLVAVTASIQAQALKITALWSGDEPPKSETSVAMVPLKVRVEYANPADLVFKQGGTVIASEYLPSESTQAGVHIFRLAPLLYGKHSFVAHAKSTKTSSPQLTLEVKGPPAPVIEAIFAPGDVPANVDNSKVIELKDLRTFYVIVQQAEPGDGWEVFVDGKRAGGVAKPTTRKDRRAIDVVLSAADFKVQPVKFQLRLIRNDWASPLSQEYKLAQPGKASATPPPKDDLKEEKKPAKADCMLPVLMYPFTHGPLVLPVAKDGPKDCEVPKVCSLLTCAQKENRSYWVSRFPGAANFPRPEFDNAGCRIDTPGTIIYEGMQLVVVADGRYEVTFNASTPRIPVTLRLTLTAVVKDSRQPIQLTLPAIEMMPDYRSADQDLGGYRVEGNNFQENWHVRHVGYSHILADQLNRHVASGHAIPNLKRDGVARFGSLPLSR